MDLDISYPRLDSFPLLLGKAAMKSNQATLPPTRRDVLKSMLAASTAPLVVPASLFGETAPSNQITLGCIGVGIHGYGWNLAAFLKEPDCRVVAVCDVSREKRERAQTGVNEAYGTTDCKAIADFRDLLARPDIDAVVISTPDHWHVPLSLLALAARKHVFCEKPTLTIAEGRELTKAVDQHDRVFATGLEDRSVMHYHRLAEVVRNGGIGQLQQIRVGLPVKPVFPEENPVPVPEGFDYEMWLGPAPYRPYTPTLTEAQVWRQVRDFSGGSLTDWGAHLIDTAQVANFSENTTPVAVSGKGTIPPNAINSVPQTYELHYTYQNGVTMEVGSSQPSIRFEGSDGWIGNQGWRGELKASDPKLLQRTYDSATNKLWPQPASEHRNFLDSIKTRQPPTYTAEALHRLSTVMHMGSIAMEVGRPLKWDPTSESFDDPAANALRSRPRRKTDILP
ncbi:Gfo/Idh/MocA family protein [Novipirellula artificiosorum]|uniref:Inositol 2-dehydrogenase n=1 Tax=Novipirellula artificiosorum TaxID=2528016 RepID=A0A5C6DRG9_9BACT|nr:Gfo/Idh/MocA family oxidoreductase [Novipirellula artificiosorum]TWU37349.1 Inositol 2-dehydrogenase [Novipirellula artificiosorum]